MMVGAGQVALHSPDAFVRHSLHGACRDTAATGRQGREREGDTCGARQDAGELVAAGWAPVALPPSTVQISLSQEAPSHVNSPWQDLAYLMRACTSWTTVIW